jgi:hypothetical protein
VTAQPIGLPPRTGEVFFPLASNAHSLVTGRGVRNVRGRLKVTSLLYNRVLIESGQISIQAGPTGCAVFRHPPGSDRALRWQTPTGRSRAQAGPISVAVGRDIGPGVPSPGPYHEVVHSETSICWLPTLEPFKAELPPGCDWIVFGQPSGVPVELQRLGVQWKRIDDENAALERLVPERFVRLQLITHVSDDLATGLAGGWDVGLDRFHGEVVSARFADDATVQPYGFALPILVPRVGNLGWDDVAAIRRLPAIERLRKVLEEVELEAAEASARGDDIESTVRTAYDAKVRDVVSDVEGLGGSLAHGLAELVVSTAAGYGTVALGLTGPAVAGVVGATVMTGLHVREVRRRRRATAWLGVMNAISEATARLF